MTTVLFYLMAEPLLSTVLRQLPGYCTSCAVVNLDSAQLLLNAAHALSMDITAKSGCVAPKRPEEQLLSSSVCLKSARCRLAKTSIGRSDVRP